MAGGTLWHNAMVARLAHRARPAVVGFSCIGSGGGTAFGTVDGTLWHSTLAHPLAAPTVTALFYAHHRARLEPAREKPPRHNSRSREPD